MWDTNKYSMRSFLAPYTVLWRFVLQPLVISLKNPTTSVTLSPWTLGLWFKKGVQSDPSKNLQENVGIMKIVSSRYSLYGQCVTQNIEEECQRNPPQVQIQSGAHLTKNYSKINSDQTFHSNIYETFSHRLKQNHQISHLIEQMMHPAFHLTLIEQGAMHQWATAPQPLTPTPISASQIHTK